MTRPRFPPPPPPAQAGYDTTEVSPRAILFAGGIVVLLLGLSLGTVKLLLHLDAPKEPARTLGAAGSFTASPNYRTSIEASWDHLAVTQARENDYGWIDRPRGIVRLPIERAMEILASEQEVRP